VTLGRRETALRRNKLILLSVHQRRHLDAARELIFVLQL
jgi:hypothetical protein